MIAPDMATMLCFVVHRCEAAGRRDAGAAEEGRRRQLQLHDGGFATPRPRTPCCCSPPARRSTRGCRRRAGAMLADFARALDAVLLDLALQVVRDGEGAQKLVRIEVTGATTARSAKRDRAGGRQFAAGEDRDRRRGRQLGPHRHGGRQGRRAGGSRQAIGRRRRRLDGARRRRGAGLRRDAGGAAHEGARGGDRHRSRPRPRQGHGVDLRPDARLHRHQWVLSAADRSG